MFISEGVVSVGIALICMGVNLMVKTLETPQYLAVQYNATANYSLVS